MLLIIHLIYFSQINNITQNKLTNKTLTITHTLTNSPKIHQNLQKKPQKNNIQTITKTIHKHNNLLFIIITNIQNLHYSHPKTQHINQPFKNNNILKTLNNKKNITINHNFLTQTLHIFTPIYNKNHKQINIITINLKLNHITQQINNNH